MSRNKMIDKTVVLASASNAIDISGQVNETDWVSEDDEVEVGAYSDLVHRWASGRESSSFSYKVQLPKAAEPRTAVIGFKGEENLYPVFVNSNAAMAEGDWAHFLAPGWQSSLQWDGKAEIASIMATGRGNGPMVTGKVLYPDVTAITSSGNSTGIQLGAISSDQTLWALLVVLAASGTLDVTVESDDNSGFTSATTRLTFAQKTAIGAQLLSLAGPQTDDYWRIAFTAGSTPNFTALVVAGII